AGIWCGDNSNPTITRCTISENEAGWNGAGINMYIDCAPVISSCVIRGNIANHKGGGIIVSEDCSPIIVDCIIADNQSVDNGGGITVERQATPLFKRCIIIGNETVNYGGAVACIENANPAIVNCTIFDNNAADTDIVFFCSASTAALVNTIFWEEEESSIVFDAEVEASGITVAYSDIEGGEDVIETNDNGEVNWMDGNIDDDPDFVDVVDWDFRLRITSPCVDAGTEFFALEGDTLVYMSEDEYFGVAPEMGALEFVSSPPLPFNLMSPENGYVSTSFIVTLQWQATTDPNEGDELSYRVYVSDDSSRLIERMIADTTNTTITYQGEMGATYWWTVKAQDLHSGGTWADEIRTFSIEAEAIEESITGSIPQKFEITSLYPNPFNPDLTAVIALPQTSHLTVKIFNILGEQVALLADDKYRPGYHRLVFNANQHASGIYLLHVAVPGKLNEVRKVILIR
ncbi:right-handed parallel beta-helix repeat-containing protein, partial [Calditrichota bacterium]